MEALLPNVKPMPMPNREKLPAFSKYLYRYRTSSSGSSTG
jgi:hypothetical protein